MALELSPIDKAKFVAAKKAVEFVEDGMRVGLGTGSTAAWMVRCLGEMVRDEGLRISGPAPRISVQVGAFADSSAAEGLAEKLRTKGYPAYLSPGTAAGATMRPAPDAATDRARPVTASAHGQPLTATVPRSPIRLPCGIPASRHGPCPVVAR